MADNEFSSFLSEIAEVSSSTAIYDVPETQVEQEGEAQNNNKRKLDEIITVSAPVTISKKAELRTDQSIPPPPPSALVSAVYILTYKFAIYKCIISSKFTCPPQSNTLSYNPSAVVSSGDVYPFENSSVYQPTESFGASVPKPSSSLSSGLGKSKENCQSPHVSWMINILLTFFIVDAHFHCLIYKTVTRIHFLTKTLYTEKSIILNFDRYNTKKLKKVCKNRCERNMVL